MTSGNELAACGVDLGCQNATLLKAGKSNCTFDPMTLGLAHQTSRVSRTKIESSRAGAGLPNVANAHAVLASSPELNSLRRCSAVLANASNSRASFWLTVATCQAGFLK